MTPRANPTDDTLFATSELPTAIQQAVASERKIKDPKAKTAIPRTGLRGASDSTVVRERPYDDGWDVYIETPEKAVSSPSTSTVSNITAHKTPSVTPGVASSTKPASDAPASKYQTSFGGSTYTGSTGSSWSGSTYTPYSYSKWVSAGIVVFQGTGTDTKVLICKGKGYTFNKFSLPKGKIEKDKGENSYAAAVREVWEETGVTARIIPDSYLGLYEGSSSLTHYYMGTHEAGTPQETKEMAWAGFLHVADALNYLRDNPRDKKALYLAYKRYAALP